MFGTGLRGHLPYLVAVSLYTVVVGFMVDFFGKPMGIDFYAHAAKLKWILAEPYPLWSPYWYAGFQPFRYYSPLPYWIYALASWAFHLTIEESILLVAFLSLAGLGLLVYLIGFEVSGLRVGGILSALLCVSSPALWSYTVRLGLYSRVTATVFSLLAIWLLVKFTGGGKSLKGWRYLLLVAATALALLSHVLLAFLTGLTFLIYLLLASQGFKGRILSVIRVFFPSAGLAAFYYVPFFLPPRKGPGFLAGRFPPMNPLTLLGVDDPKLWPFTEPPLSPPIIPLAVVAILAAYVFHCKGLRSGRVRLPAVFTFSLVSLGFLYYAEQGLFPLPILIPYVENPCLLSPYFLSIYLPLVVGGLTGMLAAKRKAYAAFILASLIWLAAWSSFLPLSISGHSLAPTGSLSPEDRKMVEEASRIAGGGYRLIPLTGLLPSLNYYADVAQTFGYYVQGDPHPDRTYWLLKVLHGSPNPFQARFLLDWYGVNCLMLERDSALPKSLGELKLVGTLPYGRLFRYDGSSPLFTAGSQPVVLFIGRDYGYRLFLENLSFANVNSQHLIPVKGVKYVDVDGYTVEELSKFNMVVLYDWKYYSLEAAERLLEAYVRGGGKLVILSDPFKFKSLKSLPSFYPIEKVKIEPVMERVWRVETSGDFPLKDVDFSRFSPLVWEGAAWSASFTLNEHVRSWARVWMWNQGFPVMVYGRLGRGEVLWVGLNLPYHALYHKNPYESLFLVELLRSLQPWNSSWTFVEASRPNFETITMRVDKPFRGLLVKESYASGWRATVTDSAGRSYHPKVYEAGLNMIYVFLPREAAYPLNVTLQYGFDLPTYVGFTLSLATLLLLILHALKSRRRLRREEVLAELYELSP